MSKIDNDKKIIYMLMDTIAAGVVEIDLNEPFTFIYLNKTATEMLGYTLEQLKTDLNNEFMALVYYKDQQNTNNFFVNLKNNVQRTHHNHRVVCRNGKILWIHGAGFSYKKEGGGKIAVITFVDVTAYKEIENHYLQRVQELLLKKKQSELAIANSDIIILDYILAEQQIICSKIAMDKYNLPHKTTYAVDKILEQNLVHPNSVKEVKRIFKEIHEGVPTAEAIIILLDKNNNNKEIILDCSVTNIFEEKNKSGRAVIVLRNITKQILIENAEMYKKALTAGNINHYEINVTRDVFISGAEYWKNILDLPTGSFSQFMEALANKIIHAEERRQFSVFMSREGLLKLYDSGKSTAVLEYRRLNSAGKYIWVSNRIHLIYDQNTKYLKALSHVQDINEKKVQELKDTEDRYYYTMMLSKSALVSEINLTQDNFAVGYQKTFDVFNISVNSSYTEVLEEVINKIIHPEDAIIFRAKYSRTSLINAYQKGIKTVICEYRRKDENDEMVWFSCAMSLVEDIETKDIKGFSYVQNIHEEKVKHLELIYKSEHDALTTLYNKATTESKIKTFLSEWEAENQKHAFLIFDIDFFKPINDNFGHAFGDALLSQIGKKVKKLFREGDIIGRIGGDEFVVFMKNIPDINIALEKAAEICSSVRESYRQKGKVYNISSSIGISFYNQHGNTYQELYEKADIALYHSKENGKNRYSLYSSNMDYKETAIKKIDQREYLEGRSFESNISEYVFRILYEAPNRTEAINSILELVGKHYKVSRAYIYENSLEGLSMTFEWCNEGVTSQRHNLQKIKQEQTGDYESYFNHEGILYVGDIRDMKEGIREIWESHGVKSMLQFSIVKEGIFHGFIGFDQYGFIRGDDRREITELKNIANLLAVFTLDIRISEANERIKNIALSVVNSLYSYAYVINSTTYELLFINERTKVVAPTAELGTTCYKSFWKRDEPCEMCPMNILKEGNKTRYSKEMYNNILDVWVKATATWVKWTDGQECCMMESVDITEYKKQIIATTKE